MKHLPESYRFDRKATIRCFECKHAHVGQGMLPSR